MKHVTRLFLLGGLIFSASAHSAVMSLTSAVSDVTGLNEVTITLSVDGLLAGTLGGSQTVSVIPDAAGAVTQATIDFSGTPFASPTNTFGAPRPLPADQPILPIADGSLVLNLDTPFAEIDFSTIPPALTGLPVGTPVKIADITLALDPTVSFTEISFALDLNTGIDEWFYDDNGFPQPYCFPGGAVCPPGVAEMLLDDALVLTNIPVPAAVWLFGTGLLGLVAVARRSAKVR